MLKELRIPEEADLVSALEAWEAQAGRREGPAPAPVGLDAEEIERLRSLGYIR